MKIKALLSVLILTSFANAQGIDERIETNDKRDSMIMDRDEFRKVYPPIAHPEFTEEQVKKIELSLQALLDDCSDLIGPKPEDKKLGVHLKRDIYISITVKGIDIETLLKLQPSYLVGRFKKCSSYVMDNPNNLDSFEYEKKSSDVMYENASKLYEVIYLNARANKFLNQLRRISIPKSLIREYANQRGLTDFILSTESKSISKLKHDDLAAIYFGSKELWQENMIKFLDQKTLELNIRE